MDPQTLEPQHEQKQMKYIQSSPYTPFKKRTLVHPDGYAWVKYGEKKLLPSRLVREYYRCKCWRTPQSGGTGCPAKKVIDSHVEEEGGVGGTGRNHRSQFPRHCPSQSPDYSRHNHPPLAPPSPARVAATSATQCGSEDPPCSFLLPPQSTPSPSPSSGPTPPMLLSPFFSCSAQKGDTISFGTTNDYLPEAPTSNGEFPASHRSSVGLCRDPSSHEDHLTTLVANLIASAVGAPASPSAMSQDSAGTSVLTPRSPRRRPPLRQLDIPETSSYYNSASAASSLQAPAVHPTLPGQFWELQKIHDNNVAPADLGRPDPVADIAAAALALLIGNAGTSTCTGPEARRTYEQSQAVPQNAVELVLQHLLSQELSCPPEKRQRLVTPTSTASWSTPHPTGSVETCLAEALQHLVQGGSHIETGVHSTDSSTTASCRYPAWEAAQAETLSPTDEAGSGTSEPLKLGDLHDALLLSLLECVSEHIE